jgi:hypothetical protein
MEKFVIITVLLNLIIAERGALSGIAWGPQKVSERRFKEQITVKIKV